MAAPRSARSAVGALLALTALAVPPPGIAAQEGCIFGDEGNDETFVETVPGGRITYISNPHFVCDGEVQIWADSAVSYSADAYSHFLGAVRYVEGTREMRAEDARYFSNVGRLQAEGNVSVVDSQDGSSVRNGDLVFLRVTDFRSEEELTVTTGADGARPRATVLRSGAELDADPDVLLPAPGPPPEPYDVTAEMINIRGGNRMVSVGDVEIVRDSLFAYADSAEYDGGTDELLLEGSARVESASYVLVGRRITMRALGEDVDELRALREAVLTGDDLRLTAPLIIAHIVAGDVDALVAVPLPDDLVTPGDTVKLARPVALAQDFELTADSLRLTSPQDVLERIFAAGSARSVSNARDSLNVEALPEIARTDWLEGDTIVVTFVPRPTDAVYPPAEGGADAGEYDVDRIVARVGARSLYRLTPSDTTARAGVDLPAVHYVVGEEITIVMSAGEVESMEVIGQTEGVHLEPLRPTRADSLADSTAMPTDTADVTPPEVAPRSATGNRPRPTADPANRPDAQPWRRP